MSELYDLISSVVRKELNGLNLTKTVPCKVIRILDNEKVEVELISNKARYAVANYSGSPVNVGETVQLFYRGIISENSAYIGAAYYKPETINFIMMESKLGLTDDTLFLISQVDLKTINDTNIEITYNASILGIDNDEVEFTIYVDDIAQEYKPLSSVTPSLKTTISFSIPVAVKRGNHSVKIYTNSIVNIERVCAFVSGQVEKVDVVFDDVSDDNFIYTVNDTNTDVILYIGQSGSPKIPNTINGQPVGKLCASAFNVSNIKAAYIPDGVIEIE